MKLPAAFLLAFLCASAIAADDPLYTRMVADGKDQRQMTILYLKRDLIEVKAKEEAAKKAKPDPKHLVGFYSTPKKAKAGVTPPPYIYHGSEAAREKELARLKDRTAELTKDLEAVKKTEWVMPELDPSKLKAGQVGVLTIERGFPVLAKAIQVVDGENVLIEIAQETHWLKTDTNGMVEGRLYKITQVVHVAGTKQHKTLEGGTKPIFLLVTYKPPK